MNRQNFPGKTKLKWLTDSRLKVLFITYTILLVLLAILPINSAGSTINHTHIVSIRLDYLLHFSIFLPWMFLLWKMVGVSFRTNFHQSLYYIFLGLLFAFANEAVQYFLPYRAFNINDLLANGLGVILGAVFFLKQTI